MGAWQLWFLYKTVFPQSYISTWSWYWCILLQNVAQRYTVKWGQVQQEAQLSLTNRTMLVSRAPSVSCATRLMLSICLFFFIRDYLPNRWTYLNNSLHGDGNWLWIEYGGFEFLRGVRLGAKNVTFCPDLPGVTFTKYNMAPKRRRYQKSKTVLFWPDNFTT